MSPLRYLAAVFLFACLSAGTVSSQPSDREVLVTVRGLGPDDGAVEAELCRVLGERLGAEDWQVICSRIPALLPADVAAAERSSAIVPFHIDIELSIDRQIAINVTTTLVPTGETILTLSSTGPRALGIERKTQAIANEVLRSMNVRLDALGGREALAALLAEPTPDPKPMIIDEKPTSADTTKGTPELALARRHRIEDLEQELALLRRQPALIVKRSRIAWIAAGVILGGAGGAWALAENSYTKYRDATGSQEAVDYRDRTLIFRNLAVSAGIIGGTGVAGALTYRFLGGRKSGMRETIKRIERQLIELKSGGAP